jgi:hypothetical protein
VLVFIPLLGMASMLAIDRTVGEVLSAGKQARDKQAFFRADGSAGLCLGELRNRLQVALRAQLPTNIADVAPYVDNNNPAGFLTQYAYAPGTSFGGPFIRDSATQARLPLTYTASGPYTCSVTVTSRGTPVNLNAGLPMPPKYQFRYGYSVDGTAEEGGTTRQVALEGSFSVLVQQDTYARYALFTNCQRRGSCVTGERVWFMGLSSFSGPVHTNGQFNFAYNPSGQFTAPADSAGSDKVGIPADEKNKARFHNNDTSDVGIALDADANGTVDVPTFFEGFQRGSAYIPMPDATTADGQRNAALGATSKPSTGKVVLGTTADGKLAGIYVNGDASIALSSGGLGTGIAVYSITQGTGGNAKTTTVTVDFTSKQTTINTPTSGNSFTTATYNGVPNGMLFVDGEVQKLGGTLQADSQLTIAATNDIRITDNMVYENVPLVTNPSAEGKNTLLGLISWDRNVHIDSSAPGPIYIHATVMTPNGEFAVDYYYSRPHQGDATILGGVIENTYGPFYKLYADGTKYGYGRNFVYDTRMGKGMNPPFFPTIGRLISTVAGINERPNWQQTN